MKTSTSFYKLFLATIFLVFGYTNAQDLNSSFEKLLNYEYKIDEPGVALIVAKDGKPIYRAARGMADLELGVKLTPENVFELGSITKQFTAVSILMLREQGKLDLEDSITKFIPDYPTQGRTITIRHLLNHTSGIKSYTSMPNFMETVRKDLSPEELIEVFKNEPMDFEPGEKFLYNNSGYILLGYIIEKVSGESYKNFVEKNIFQPLGMNSSYYGSHSEIIPNRASGYQSGNDDYINANFLSMKIPYAAGSLMSTVDDLLIWQNAINSNKLISKESLDKAIHGSVLNDGKKINYGFAWNADTLKGSPTYQHSGGIFGFTTNEIYLPKEKIYVAALSNCNCRNVPNFSTKIAAIAIGKPFPDLTQTVNVSIGKLEKWVGTYKFKGDVKNYIRLEGDTLRSQRSGEPIMKLLPVSENKFVLENGITTYNFTEKNGNRQVEITGVNSSETGTWTDEPVPTKKEGVALSINILKKYIGTYEIQPGFVVEVSLEGNQLFAQPTGQNKIEILADEEDKFFNESIPVDLKFNKNEEGEVVGLDIIQGDNVTSARKM